MSRILLLTTILYQSLVGQSQLHSGYEMLYWTPTSPLHNPSLFLDKSAIGLEAGNQYGILEANHLAMSLQATVHNQTCIFTGLRSQFNSSTSYISQVSIPYRLSKQLTTAVSLSYSHINQEGIDEGNNLSFAVSAHYRNDKREVVVGYIHGRLKAEPATLQMALKSSIADKLEVFLTTATSPSHFNMGLGAQLNYANKRILLSFQPLNQHLSGQLQIKLNELNVLFAIKSHPFLGASPSAGIYYEM